MESQIIRVWLLLKRTRAIAIAIWYPKTKTCRMYFHGEVRLVPLIMIARSAMDLQVDATTTQQTTLIKHNSNLYMSSPYDLPDENWLLKWS